MSDAVVDFLRDLQGLVSATQLYAREHPRVVELLAHGVRHAQASTVNGEISALCIDERLVVDTRVVPASGQIVTGIFAVLERCGYHRITLKAGVTADELHDFAARVARAKHASTEDVSLESTQHLDLSAIEQAWRPTPLAKPEAARETPALEDIWDGIVDGRHCNLDAIEFIVMALARTIEKHASSLIPLAALRNHDDYTLMHITNVAMLAMGLSEAIGLPPKAINQIGTAALLHDIGKLRVPADILNTPGRLTPEQVRIVRRHPEEGARLLLATPGVSDLSVVVAYEHHIQFDGGGYPSVPRGWKLNLASAITTIADVYDALRSDRPYRRGLEGDGIKGIMTNDAGTVFEPALVRIFFERVVPRTIVAPREVGHTAPGFVTKPGEDLQTGPVPLLRVGEASQVAPRP